MSRAAFVVLGCLFVALVGCASTERRPDTNLVFLSSRSLLPLVTDLAARFRERRPSVRIDIEPGSSERILTDTRQGLADVSFLGRSLRPEENGVQSAVLGRDGIAILVHRDNPVQRLSEPHLVGVLSRVYTNWRDVGGSDRPVLVVGVGEGRALREVLLDRFALRPGQLRPDPVVGTSEQVVQAVAGQPGGIGYASLGVVEKAAREQPVRLLPYQDVPATTANVRDRSYPLTRNLLILTREKPTGILAEFVTFARAEDSHDLITKHGFVPGG